MSREQDLVQMPVEQARKQYFESRKGEVREATLKSQSTPIKKFAEWCQDCSIENGRQRYD